MKNIIKETIQQRLDEVLCSLSNLEVDLHEVSMHLENSTKKKQKLICERNSLARFLDDVEEKESLR